MAQQQSIIILGNSGFARECHVMLRHVMERSPEVTFKGFLSFEGFPSNLKSLSHLFLGDDEAYNFQPQDAVIIGIGDPALRARAFAKLQARSIAITNLVHPQSYIDPSITLGTGNIIGYNTHISCDCTMGDGNILNGLVHVGHDCIFGNHNFIGPGVQVLGSVTMGDKNSIGATSVLLPHASMGNSNIVAPLSAVFKGCRSNCYMAGNPAVKIGNKDVS